MDDRTDIHGLFRRCDSAGPQRERCRRRFDKWFGQVKVGQGLLGHVLQTAQPLIIPSLADQQWSEEFQKMPYGSLLALPLVIHGGSIGVFCLFRDEANSFNQDDLRVLFIVANQCAFAVQNGRLYQETARLAITDGLTGLFNHRYFRACIEEAVNRAENTGNPVSMIMIDADGFKGINDKYGHQRGDQVLQDMAQIITRGVRESDFVARYGGEEFAVILPDTGPREAYQVAARIHQMVATADFDGLRATVSLGVATYPSNRVKSKDDLISMADEYAYRAKEGGRNRICSADL
jgi:diguanylate cyclase (GGDEF)-like protein